MDDLCFALSSPPPRYLPLYSTISFSLISPLARFAPSSDRTFFLSCFVFYAIPLLFPVSLWFLVIVIVGYLIPSNHTVALFVATSNSHVFYSLSRLSI